MADWFAPKRFGIGTGLPIAWQGWAVTISYIILVASAALLFHRNRLASVAILIPSTIAFMIIVVRTTKGGWRWRWVNDD